MLISEHATTIDACRFCFMCRHVCTAGVTSGRESDIPRGKGLILFKILKGHADYSPELVESLYRCCLCGLCETWCQADCHPPDAVLAARADVVAQGKAPVAVEQIKDRLLRTGKPLSLLGYRDEARAMAAQLAADIRGVQPKLLVTTCPSAFDAFTSDYPAMGVDLGGVEVLHAVQYVDRLMEQGLVAAREQGAAVAAFLDGTYLGRTHGVYDQPRRVLGRIAGLTLREMAWTRELAYSCGEPGGVFHLLHPQWSRRMGARVLEEAAKTGADLLITACPAALTLLQAANHANLPVRDLVEVVADAVDGPATEQP